MDVKEIVGSIFSIAAKVVIVMLAVTTVKKYAAMSYDYGYRLFTEPPVSTGEGRNVEIIIGEDTKVKEIGEKLENTGLVRDGKLFILQELVDENHGKITPGRYYLNTNMTATEMIAIMANAEKKLTEDELLNNEDESILGIDEAIGLDSDETMIPEDGMMDDDVAPADEMFNEETEQ